MYLCEPEACVGLGLAALLAARPFRDKVETRAGPGLADFHVFLSIQKTVWDWAWPQPVPHTGTTLISMHLAVYPKACVGLGLAALPGRPFLRDEADFNVFLHMHSNACVGLALAALPGRPSFREEVYFLVLLCIQKRPWEWAWPPPLAAPPRDGTDFHVFLYIQNRAWDRAWPPPLAVTPSGTKLMSMYFCVSKKARGTGPGRNPWASPPSGTKLI